MRLDLLERLLNHLNLKWEWEWDLKGDSMAFITPSERKIKIGPEGFVVTKGTHSTANKITRGQWASLVSIENRLRASGVVFETAVDDHGRWVIRCAENVSGAHSIDWVFSAGTEKLTKIVINEE
jgi:hypothetical protein